MTHFEEMLVQLDNEADRIAGLQITDPNDPDAGAFVEAGYHIDSRHCGFMLSHLADAYLIPESRHYHSEKIKAALERGFAYLLSHQRPGGCLDLTGCNFASAPDTAFTMNGMMNAWWLLEKDPGEEALWLRGSMRRLIETCCEGVMNGGFHTPNHRWAIAACLKHAAKICGRDDFSRKADVYLGEGLDIDEDGEFAERSTGTYNAVNDDQMIRLFLATGDRAYLEAARKNLVMMLHYIDPDGSVFTNNSTRQDYGKKVYPENYYILFLLTGYLLKDEWLAAFSECCWQAADAHGDVPRGLPWLALYPDLAAFGQRAAVDTDKIQHYRRMYPKSRIGRYRNGDFSCTVMANRPNFLYFQHGENTLYLVIYGNVCEKRNFVPQTIEETEKGFRVAAVMDSWYYLPFQGNGPATSDWWAMDNGNTREKLIQDRLKLTVDVDLLSDGVDVRVRAGGLTRVPLRLEWGFMPGNTLRSDAFIIDTAAGGGITVCRGMLQADRGPGETITLGPAFASHNVKNRMGGAYPQSAEHFTVFFTAYSPFDQVIHIGIKPVFDSRL